MIEYGTNESLELDLKSGEVRLGLKLDGRSILCRVPRALFQDDTEASPTPDARLEIAKIQFDRITDAVGRLAVIGRFERDGSIFLHPSDHV